MTDTYPATVKGPLSTTSSRLVTFARVIVHEGRLFVAEGRQRGAIVTSVTEYPAPEGEPERDPRRSKGGSWGEWSWSSCGCSSSWTKHSVESLIAQAVPSPALAAQDIEGDTSEAEVANPQVSADDVPDTADDTIPAESA